MTPTAEPYISKYKIRILTAASLFDGHDAAINIMRRILQSSGAEVIHLGHNRSVEEIVNAAIQEDVQAIAITSYQGGHMEFFKYAYDLLKLKNAGHIKLFGGGGGTILPNEIEELHQYGITRIYSPDDGRSMGLQGMINDLLQKSDFLPATFQSTDVKPVKEKQESVAQWISLAENEDAKAKELIKFPVEKAIAVLGVTGTGGAGKSSLVDELVRRYLLNEPDKTIAIISIDPSKRKSGGALLGDRIRMTSINSPRVYMRSLATRQSNLAISKHIKDAVLVCKVAGYDLIIVETSGIGQSDTEITDISDASVYVMTPEYGAATQLEKIDMLDFADIVAINKFDKRGALDALRDVKKQYKRNRKLWDDKDETLPVVGTIASQFNDPGMDLLYIKTIEAINSIQINNKFNVPLNKATEGVNGLTILPADRTRYLAEIAEREEDYKEFVEQQANLATAIYQLEGSIEQVKNNNDINENEAAISLKSLSELHQSLRTKLDPMCHKAMQRFRELEQLYQKDKLQYQVRDKIIENDLKFITLSGIAISKIAIPKYKDHGDLLRWILKENFPGEFPYTAGVFPLKRQGEDPTRMFAGEGGPERTNKRFHYLSLGQPAKRLSTAFDSVTLYGEDPDHRPDIYGKVGNSGVSIATIDDAKKLYSGFNLCHPSTSVSMTINGPAPMLLAFFLNAAIDQQCELYIKNNGLVDEVKGKINAFYSDKGITPPHYSGNLPEGNDGLGLLLLGISGEQVLPAEIYQKIKQETLCVVRGTVQADILKEDQAQNTCIFSTEFALKMMGDIQQYFSQNNVKNFYSVSISGYHIAEAGANPITQLAFTLANGFTYVEYYLSRGMSIDDFAPNLSFFFSNGLDPEYSVIGRVARRIWAKAIKNIYNGNDRSQKLKYHIQTSGRSLHAQEISFNDIRTTLQALYAIYDNCNSLHTNAYDEAITTPTEESVRRAMAIQMILNKEFGLARNENPLQGAFIIEELTDLVEEAVMIEFKNLSERGGVLGAMERMYQRSKIQDESLYYETMKHTGRLPVVGVNTFLDPKGSPTIIPQEVIRANNEEKEFAISSLNSFKARNNLSKEEAIKKLKTSATHNKNIFEELMEVSKVCTLGEITHALYEVGGQYRRNM